MSNKLRVITPADREHLVSADQLPDVLVKVYGGYTPDQVANAMEAQARLQAGHTVTANGFTLELLQEN